MSRRGKCTKPRKKRCVLCIAPSGELRFVFNDALASLVRLGDARIRRASYVEPLGTKWCADLSPVHGPLLGPYDTRQEALDDETLWLNGHNIPTPLDPD